MRSSDESSDRDEQAVCARGRCGWHGRALVRRTNGEYDYVEAVRSGELCGGTSRPMPRLEPVMRIAGMLVERVKAAIGESGYWWSARGAT